MVWGFSSVLVTNLTWGERVGKTISAMYARKNFGQILNQAALLNEDFVIERAGKPMAAIVPIQRLESCAKDCSGVERALEKVIKKIKGAKSKKLEKAIEEARQAVRELRE